MTLKGAPPVLHRKKINASAVKWYREKLIAAQQKFQAEFNLPLAMVGIDPLIDAADFQDENDASEANRAMRTFDALANEFDCVFFVCDHAGKDVTRGSRGASSKPGKAHFVLSLPERIADPQEHRTLTRP
jgi:signal transduction histidine kinase